MGGSECLNEAASVTNAAGDVAGGISDGEGIGLREQRHNGERRKA
jgi:hypothetical protein